MKNDDSYFLAMILGCISLGIWLIDLVDWVDERFLKHWPNLLKFFVHVLLMGLFIILMLYFFVEVIMHVA